MKGVLTWGLCRIWGMTISPYERRLILSYLSNAFSHLCRRDQDAKSLLLWIRKHEDQLELPYSLQADGEADGAKQHKFSRVLQALSDALAKARNVRPDCTARRLRLLARATRLSRTDIAILELVLRYHTGALVVSMMDDVTRSRYWRRTFRLGNPVLPRLLGLSAGAVHRRFASDAPLVTSGLVSIDDDGDMTLVDRLKRLHWLPKDAGSDVQSLLLDEARPAELRWSDFDHVAGDRDHLERLLTGALQCGQKGVNILIHGMPGTGKTEFCKTLAARARRAVGAAVKLARHDRDHRHVDCRRRHRNGAGHSCDGGQRREHERRSPATMMMRSSRPRRGGGRREPSRCRDVAAVRDGGRTERSEGWGEAHVAEWRRVGAKRVLGDVGRGGGSVRRSGAAKRTG